MLENAERQKKRSVSNHTYLVLMYARGQGCDTAVLGRDPGWLCAVATLGFESLYGIGAGTVPADGQAAVPAISSGQSCL